MPKKTSKKSAPMKMPSGPISQHKSLAMGGGLTKAPGGKKIKA